ncbi:MAG: benzoate-CoA ligase family protein [Actinomycetota bacterium]|nr:benzoate-CoA ligase family protein [Actinomycetota bacterium]
MQKFYNASETLLDRQIEAGFGNKTAIITDEGSLTYLGLLTKVDSLAQQFIEDGIRSEERIMMLMADSIDFAVTFLAAMRVGAIPVPISTMLHSEQITELIVDSRARALAVSPQFSDLVKSGFATVRPPELDIIYSAGDIEVDRTYRYCDLRDVPIAPYAGRGTRYTGFDSPCFWLYTSGTTGRPKGAMHRHGSIEVAANNYAVKVLGIKEDDRTLSAAKAFFAYGLGNSILFPLFVGATTILVANPSRPELIADQVDRHGATLFFGGPTFFANMMHSNVDAKKMASVRLSASAGEPLPPSLYEKFTERFGFDILDGIGMTEMLHIFLSNREGEVRAGTTGVAVPGYDLKIIKDDGAEAKEDETGTLYVRGDSTAIGYYSRYEASREVFQGEWLRTGDTYVKDKDGYYRCLGRTSDMLKASGIWVSPTEVEEALVKHSAVAQAVVVSAVDEDQLEKPVAFVILNEGGSATEEELIAHCREALPSFERPRKIVFVTSFPTTATGKVRRVELREQARGLLS